MTQDQCIILLFKVVEVAGIVTVGGFVACYSWWAPWWRDQIGRTIVVKDALLLLAFVPPMLSLFFHFSRLSSHVAAWVDIALVGLISPVMIWRTIVFWKIHRNGKLVMKRALSPSTNPAGLLSAAAAIYAAVVMIWHATHHQGVIDPQVLVAAISAAGTLYARFLVTPVADPKDGNGKPLTPPDPTQQAELAADAIRSHQAGGTP